VPTGSAEGFIRRVLALPLPGRLLSELAPLLAVMRQVNEQLAYSDERIAAVERADERVQRLQTVPTVGPVTAAAFVAALDDAGRFTRAHQVEAYLGLVPREWSSGEGQHRGRITKAGHRRVRWLLVQAAVSMLRVRHPKPGDLTCQASKTKSCSSPAPAAVSAKQPQESSPKRGPRSCPEPGERTTSKRSSPTSTPQAGRPSAESSM
jgi:transposase